MYEQDFFFIKNKYKIIPQGQSSLKTKMCILQRKQNKVKTLFFEEQFTPIIDFISISLYIEVLFWKLTNIAKGLCNLMRCQLMKIVLLLQLLFIY